jgi:hypothetical protein
MSLRKGYITFLHSSGLYLNKTKPAKEEWKKTQKKAKKDMTLDTINKIIP